MSFCFSYEKSFQGWDENQKLKEFKHKNARYLIVREVESKKPIAFSHFRFDMDYNSEVIYW